MTSITTTNGSIFTMTASADLARAIYLRFGEDAEAATQAWRRMLENSCTTDDFMALVFYPDHSPNCKGWCQDPGYDYDYEASKRAVAVPPKVEFKCQSCLQTFESQTIYQLNDGRDVCFSCMHMFGP